MTSQEPPTTAEPTPSPASWPWAWSRATGWASGSTTTTSEVQKYMIRQAMIQDLGLEEEKTA